MSFHFKLLGAQYFKKLQRNITSEQEKKLLEKLWWHNVNHRKKNYMKITKNEKVEKNGERTHTHTNYTVL